VQTHFSCQIKEHYGGVETDQKYEISWTEVILCPAYPLIQMARVFTDTDFWTAWAYIIYLAATQVFEYAGL
jgi:hypothetical protein